MRNITKIFILVFSLILLLAVSCSNDDKTGIKNNPPEDMEITDGETGSGSGGSSGTETGGGTGTGGDSGTETGGGTGTGGDSGTETGGGTGTGGDSGTETGGGTGTGTGGDSGSGTGTGGSGEGGSGSGSGSGEGGSGTETPPSETEITETINAKDFPTELLGRYKDDKLPNGYHFETEVSTITTAEGIKKTQIEGSWLEDGTTDDTSRQVVTIEKWKQTKKGGNPIKLEGESSDGGTGKYTVIYDYASGTLSGKYTHPDGTWSFNGKK